MSDKRYTKEFKIEAVKQITEHDYAIQDVAKRLGVSPHSLYLWRKKYSTGAASAGQIDDHQAELKHLRAELKRVTEEWDIPKKSTAYFGKESL